MEVGQVNAKGKGKQGQSSPREEGRSRCGGKSYWANQCPTPIGNGKDGEKGKPPEPKGKGKAKGREKGNNLPKEGQVIQGELTYVSSGPSSATIASSTLPETPMATVQAVSAYGYDGWALAAIVEDHKEWNTTGRKRSGNSCSVALATTVMSRFCRTLGATNMVARSSSSDGRDLRRNLPRVGRRAGEQ